MPMDEDFYLDYDQLAAAYARNRQVHPGVLSALLARGSSPLQHVLEVGCGTGNYLVALHQTTGWPGMGVDPSMQMLAVARARVPAIPFRQGKAEQLPVPDAEFDLIFSVDVIHHVRDRSAYFAEAFRALHPGGTLCTVTDSEAMIRRRRPLSSHFPETVIVELARYPGMAELRAEMTAAGFVAIEQAETEHAYDLTDLSAYREQAFSSLRLIAPEAFHRGMARMEEDLVGGPIPALSIYTLLWATKPS
jgi:SAM-dependent methyltransferase